MGVGVYDNSPRYYDYGYRYSRQPRTNSVEESTAYRSQSWYPQSPPQGGGN